MNSKRQDVIGPMGKSTWDVAALLDAIIDPCPSYVQTLPSRPKALPEFEFGLLRDGFLPTHPSPSVTQAEEMFLDGLVKLGPVHEHGPIEGLEQLWKKDEQGVRHESFWFEVEHHEAFKEFMAGLRDCPISTIEDLVEWNNLHPVCRPRRSSLSLPMSAR